MKKITLSALALGLLLAAQAPVLAQTKTKIKVKSEGPTPDMNSSTGGEAGQTPTSPNTQPIQSQAEKGTGTGKVGGSIPVAEYYDGGQEAMYAFIAKEIKYPLLAKRNRIQGRCIISFTLNPDGTMSGVKLVKQVGGGTGEEALRVVRLLKFKKPEYPILTSLPIDFKLGVTGSNATEGQ